MPIVRITWFEGRSHEQKAELARVITEAVSRIGKTAPQGTQVIFEDIPKENWASGGILKSDQP